MRKIKKTIFLDWVCIFLIIMSGPVRVLFNVIPGYSCNIIIFLLYTSALFIWISQVKRRLLQNEECKFLSGVAALMLFLMAVRTIKFDFLPSGSVYARYAWYLYYVPQTLAVLWMFFAVLYIGKPYHYQLERKWRILYIPAFILIGGIMTNDFHQFAFRFPDGIQNWGMEYTRGFLYILAIGWIVLFCAMILVITFSRCAFSQNRRKIWIPMIPLGIGGVYTIIYILSPKGLFPSLYKMAEVICFIFPAFMECLILARLLPSNDSYMDLWQVSSAGGGLMDFEGNIFYSSEKCLPVKKEQIITAKRKTVLLSDEQTILRSHEVSGGWGFWYKDISDILKLNRNLEDVGDVLVEENAMLEGAIRLSEKKIKVEEKNQLYNEIAREVSPQLKELNELLDSLEQNDQDIREKLCYGGVLNVYIKRCSNLLIMSRQSGVLNVGELWLALSESLEYMRLYGIKAYGEKKGEGFLYGKDAILVYESFEKIIESVLQKTRAVMVLLDMKDVLSIKIELDRVKSTRNLFEIQKKFEKCNGTFETFSEEDTLYIRGTLPLLGGGVS